MATELIITIGGYPHTFKPSTAGQFGCDMCWGCGERPIAGTRIWTDRYGDLWCDDCAQRDQERQPMTA